MSERQPLICRACGREGDAELVMLVERLDATPIRVLECASCGSLDLIRSESEVASTATYHLADSEIDSHIESNYGLETIVSAMAAARVEGVRTMLDVGCGYGFSVHIAEKVFGWKARGVEPGSWGARGAKDLRIEISAEPLEPAKADDPKYDLVLATEVLEHVMDPEAFLATLRTHIAAGGSLVITTPAAEVLDGGASDDAIRSALSPGHHTVLLSERGLREILVRAGFGSVSVARSGGSLRAIAAVEPNVAVSAELREVPPIDLETYYAESARSAPKGSALELAMTTRHYRSLVNRAAWSAAGEVRARLVSLMRRRYKVDLSAPETVAIDRSAIPPVTVVIAFAMGMHALLGDDRIDEARAYFSLVLASVHDQLTNGLPLGADVLDLELQARRSLVLIAARTGSPRVHTLIRRLETRDRPENVEASVVVALTEAVSGGHLDLARELQRRAGGSAGRIASSEDVASAMIGLNGLLSLALLDLQSGRAKNSLGWLRLARLVLSASAERLPEDYVARFEDDVDRHRALAEDRADEPVALEPAPLAEPASPVAREEVAGAVSVIMPVYNGAKYLHQAIRSVVKQQTPPLELIVIDDGSVDDSVAIAELIESDFPIIVISQDNAGQSAARNAGVAHARAEFLAFLDQDDEWRPNHLSTLVEMMLSDRAIGWAFTDFDQVNSDGHTVTTHYVSEAGVQHPKRSLAAVIGSDLMVLPSASLIRREAFEEVGGFDPRLIGYEDDDLFVRIYRAGWRHAFIPESTTRYRVHLSGSSNSLSFLRSRLIFMEKLLRTIPDNHTLNLFYSQDVIVPRFYQATLSDYSIAIATRDYDRAREFAIALKSISKLQGNRSRRRQFALNMLQRPVAARRFVGFIDRAPRRVRALFNPALFSGYRHVMRASRFHPEFSDQSADF